MFAPLNLRATALVMNVEAMGAQVRCNTLASRKLLQQPDECQQQFCQHYCRHWYGWSGYGVVGHSPGTCRPHPSPVEKKTIMLTPCRLRWNHRTDSAGSALPIEEDRQHVLLVDLPTSRVHRLSGW